jgi:hypothetical protein
MNTGQMMLVIGALALLSVSVLNINGMIIGTQLVGFEMESTLNAVSIAQTLLDEVIIKEFDENSITQRVYTPTNMTPTANFGRETGETIIGADTMYLSRTRFDDVDDYHNYTRNVTDPRMGVFTVISTVSYIVETNFDQTTTAQTFIKQITVSVTNPYMIKQQNDPSQVVPVVMKDLAIYRRYF